MAPSKCTLSLSVQCHRIRLILALITYVWISLLQTQLLIIVVVWIVLVRVRLDDVIAVETSVIVATSVVIVRRR